jgi:predicted HTH domain antitoxin
MALMIPDSVLEQAGLSEDEARVEIACRLFELHRLGLWQAAQYARLTRGEMEAQLLQRRILLHEVTEEQLAVVRIDERYWEHEL